MIPRILLLLFALSSAGCSSSGQSGSAQGPNQEAALHEVGGLIRIYSGETGRGPKKASDLEKYEHGHPLGYRAVQSGQIVVVWGATIAGEGDASSAPPNVIAYEKNVSTDGGLVLLQNGTVKQMSAAEFASAPKAK